MPPVATGPTPTLPSSGGGYQVGEGNIAEPNFTRLGTPAAYTTTATAVVADLAGGLITTDASGGGYTLTLPTAAALDAAFPSAGVNSALKFTVISIGTNTTTVAVGTGITGVGTLTVATATSVTFTLRKTGDAAWSLYRGG